MLKKKGRIGVILFTFIIAASMVFTACGGNKLKGAKVTFASWSNAYNVNTYVPRNEDEEISLEMRKKFLADNGVEIEQIELSGWDDYFPMVISNIMSGNKEYGVYCLPGDWAMTLYKQGLLFPISDSSVKLNNRKMIAGKSAAYNKMMEDLFTFNGKTYAVGVGLNGDSWHGVYLFWNKRLFREVGLDPDLPYDLQKAGTWTWDAFYDICKQVTRDIDSDGITDIYALPCDDAREVLDGLVFSNNANWVTLDSNGNAQNATNRPEFIEALTFYQRLINEGLMAVRPENAAWDWDFTTFFDGRVAMLIPPEWRKGQMVEMADDYGCVLVPKGPRASNYRMPNDESVWVVPNIFTKAEVDIILAAFDGWMRPSSDDWQGGQYWAFRDRRAVDETVAMIKESSDFVSYKNYTLIPGYPKGDILMGTRFWEEGTPSQLVESWAPRFQAALDDANR